MKINGINPAVLIWAREAAGLSADEAAKKLGLADSAKQTATDKLAALESGEERPSRSQIMKISKVYNRPLLTFYMANPPAEGRKGEDFRQTRNEVSKRENALLDVLRRQVRARQEMVRSVLEDDEDIKKVSFVGSVTMAQGVSHLVRAMASELHFDHTSLAGRPRGASELFRVLRAKAEDAGIFVLMLGDVGSWHSAISAEVFRGFAIADPIAPFVVVNSNDALAARSFTLIHELAHLWLGQSGVSGEPSAEDAITDAAKVEQFCNDAAGEFLLPDGLFWQNLVRFDPSDQTAASQTIAKIAQDWSVSEPMVAFRLRRRREITSAVYQALYLQYLGRWRAAKEKEKAERPDGNTGPSPYVMKKFALGAGLLEFVRRTVRENAMTYTKAAKVLGTQPGAVEPLLRKFEKNNKSFTSIAEGTF